MFSGPMANAWIVATMVAAVAGAVGFFVVLRGSTFVAHAIPNAAFAGAAGASLIGASTIVGLGVFSLAGVLGIGWLGKRGRHDVATALSVTVLLALGALFLSFSSEYEPEVSALLFGDILGVSTAELLPTALVGVAGLVAICALFRPLLFSSVIPSVAEARGVRGRRMEIWFLLVVAVATTMAVPLVGTLLMFSLMVGPPAAARSVTARPLVATMLAVAFALLCVWGSIAESYATNWPIGFFVGVNGVLLYAGGRCWAGLAGGARAGRPRPPASEATARTATAVAAP